MRKTTAVSLIIMYMLSLSAIWSSNLQSLALLIGFWAVLYNGIKGNVTFQECGFSPSLFGVMLTKGIHRTIFSLPILIVGAEVLVGRILFDGYIKYSLEVLDDRLLFTDTGSLLLCIILLVIIEEVPWRCHVQLQIGRALPWGFALILPAIGICLMSWPAQISFLSMYFIFGMFIRRILWGMLYEQSGSVWVVILSHFIATLFHLILVVGI